MHFLRKKSFNYVANYQQEKKADKKQFTLHGL
jgi:hypothetical protein